MADQEKTSVHAVGNEKHVHATQTKTITNINYDCLERIFELLDVESLLNLADTCKRLRIGAAHYFDDKFCKNFIMLSEIDNSLPAVEVDSDIIISNRLKTALATLRCFGNKITCLGIQCNDYLKQYIMQYCGDALTAIHFDKSVPVFSIEDCQQPFKNVKNLYISNAVLKGQLAGIAHWFPFIKYANFIDVSIDDDFVGVCLPKCLHFEFQKFDQTEFKEHVLSSFLHVNRQLENLEIILSEKMALSTLLEMIRDNSSLVDVKISHHTESPMNMVEPVELERFANEHPSIMRLHLQNYQLTADDAIAFIRQLNSLKTICFNVIDHSEYNRLINQLDKKWRCDLRNVISDVHFIELNC